jgi:hypothetical protein
MYLPLHRFIDTELGNIVHEGRYGRDLAILDDVFVPFCCSAHSLEAQAVHYATGWPRR